MRIRYRSFVGVLGLGACLLSIVACGKEEEPAVTVNQQRAPADQSPAQPPSGVAAAPAESAATPPPVEQPGSNATAPASVSAGPAVAGDQAPRAAPPVIQTQETNISGVVAELIECARNEGVLTVKVRFRNSGDQPVRLYAETHHGEYREFSVTASGKKYFVLKDTEGAPLAPKYLDANLAKGQTYLWWAKFPAPPTDVKKVDVIIPGVLPFENVPISD